MTNILKLVKYDLIKTRTALIAVLMGLCITELGL